MITKTPCVFYFFISLISATHMFADSPQEIFLQANKLYDEKEFESAHALYASLERKDGAVLYNMGNCSYKLGDYASAIACWHQAQKDATPHVLAHIQHNIEAGQKKLGLENHHTVIDLIEKSLRNISLLWLQILFLFGWFSLFLFIKKYKHGTKYRMFFVMFLLLLLIGSGTILLIKYRVLTQRKGIVMQSNVSVFAGPDEQFHVLASMPQASCVHIAEQRDQWCKIKYKNVTGWVMKDVLTVV